MAPMKQTTATTGTPARSQHRSDWRLRGVAFVFAGMLVATLVSPAQAWSPDTHVSLLLRGLGERVEHGAMVLPEPEDIVGFYKWLSYSLAGAREPDAGGRERFFALYPEPKTFDAIGARRFFGLTADPNVEVFGVSAFDRDAELDRYDVLLFASSRWHSDGRFRQPHRFGPNHRPLHLADGNLIPDDPRTLHFGPLEGAASDEWARTALPTAATATDDGWLERAPWRFVAPVSEGVEVVGGAARMVQIHMDMALMALAWGGMELKIAGEYLSIVWLGAAMGLVLDASSPFAAVQAGSPSLWRAAAAAHRLRALRTGGGVWAPLPTRAWLAARIRRNLRVIGERLIEAEILREIERPGSSPSAAALLAGLAEDDPDFARTLRERAGPWLRHDGKPDAFEDGIGAGYLGVVALADAATADASRAYDLVAAIADDRWLSGDELLGDQPAADVRLLADADDPAVELARRELLAMTARAMRRSMTLQRQLLLIWQTANGRSALGRLRQGGLAHLEDRVARQLPWREGAIAPVGGFGAERIGWVAAAELALALALLAAAALWWRRRR
jgi:hypothetical protein